MFAVKASPLTRSGAWSPTTWAAWLVLLLLATVVGIYSMRYALPNIPAPANLPSFVSHRKLLIIHAVTASVALLLGPWQFVAGFRRWRLPWHRWMGRAYGLSVLVAGLTAFPVATNASQGIVSSLGFMTLAVFWLAATATAIRHAMKGRIPEHRRWMVRSYALTAAAVTLRILLAGSTALHLPFHIAYPAIAWLSWVPNWIVAEMWLRAELRRRQHVAVITSARTLFAPAGGTPGLCPVPGGP